MSSLANTTWTATLDQAGTQTWAFNSDGTVKVTFPNGQVSTGYYAELTGTFIIQMPNSSANPNINNIYFGSHRNGVGIGDWVHYAGNGNESVLLALHMSKNA